MYVRRIDVKNRLIIFLKIDSFLFFSHQTLKFTIYKIVQTFLVQYLNKTSYFLQTFACTFIFFLQLDAEILRYFRWVFSIGNVN